VDELSGLGSFDAVTGRLQEYDFSSHSPPSPSNRLIEQAVDLFNRVFAAGGAHPRIGAQLYQLMSQAGFVALDAWVEYGVDGGPDSLYYEWNAELLRAILPLAVSKVLVTSGDIDTYEQRLRRQTVLQHAAAAGPAMFGIVARRPVLGCQTGRSTARTTCRDACACAAGIGNGARSSASSGHGRSWRKQYPS